MNARSLPSTVPACTLEHLSTRELEPELRFEAWRTQGHQFVELQPLPTGADLDAELLTLRTTTCTLGSVRSASGYTTRTKRSKRANAPEMVVITLMQAGEVGVNASDADTPRRIQPGALGLYDLTKLAHYEWSKGSREIFLALPRSEAVAALGREPQSLTISLDHCVLAPALTAQLTLLARHAPALHDVERAGIMATAHAMALLLLRHIGREGHRAADSGDVSPGLLVARHAAAMHFMELEAHRPDLNAGAIASGAGCSRTRLYEAFAAQGTTVMGALRELRLQRARRLIEQSTRLHLGALSWRCGFADQSSFSKLFKSRFGMPPTQWHLQARADASNEHPQSIFSK